MRFLDWDLIINQIDAVFVMQPRKANKTLW